MEQRRWIQREEEQQAAGSKQQGCLQGLVPAESKGDGGKQAYRGDDQHRSLSNEW